MTEGSDDSVNGEEIDETQKCKKHSKVYNYRR